MPHVTRRFAPYVLNYLPYHFVCIHNFIEIILLHIVPKTSNKGACGLKGVSAHIKGVFAIYGAKRHKKKNKMFS